MTKILTGKVIKADKSKKTVTVETEFLRPHPLYKKLVKKNKKILAHLDNKEVVVGNIVRIGETRPLSKRKHFKILEVIR